MNNIESNLLSIISDLSKLKTKPNFSDKVTSNTILLFLAVMQDKIIDLNNIDELSNDTLYNMSVKFGNELMHLIHVYTGINIKYDEFSSM